MLWPRLRLRKISYTSHTCPVWGEQIPELCWSTHGPEPTTVFIGFLCFRNQPYTCTTPFVIMGHYTVHLAVLLFSWGEHHWQSAVCAACVNNSHPTTSGLPLFLWHFLQRICLGSSYLDQTTLLCCTSAGTKLFSLRLRKDGWGFSF